MKQFTTFSLVLLFSAFTLQAQDTYQQRVQQYIETYKSIAISEMQRTGVPASITLAQGVLETEAGKSTLATDANNHFGIKCHNEWGGETFYWDDDAKDECFRKYKNVDESFKDHSDFLKTRNRYAALFLLSTTDYKGWAKGLKACGYATNPRYADMLINLVETNHLQQYDLMGGAENYAVKDQPDTAKVFASMQQKGQDPETDAIVTEVHTKSFKGRVYLFNNIKTVEIMPGETTKKIASDYAMSLKRLMKYNDMTDKTVVKAGDKIYLQPKRRNGNEAYHNVKEGETMYSIAQQHGIQLLYLYTKNKMKTGTQPAPGEIIYLRSDRTAPPRLNTETIADVTNAGIKAGEMINEEENRYYTVQKGDTLYSISKKYNLTVADLKTLNRLSSDSLAVGDKLKVQ